MPTATNRVRSELPFHDLQVEGGVVAHGDEVRLRRSPRRPGADVGIMFAARQKFSSLLVHSFDRIFRPKVSEVMFAPKAISLGLSTPSRSAQARAASTSIASLSSSRRRRRTCWRFGEAGSHVRRRPRRAPGAGRTRRTRQWPSTRRSSAGYCERMASCGALLLLS